MGAVMTGTVKITWNEYEVGTGIGCWLKSSEVVPLGTVRFLAGKLMYAYARHRVHSFFGKKYDTWWTPIENNNYDELHKWRALL